MLEKQKKDLIYGSAELGLSLSSHQVDLFLRFTKLLEKWNQSLNLTRIPEENIVPLHFLDSLTVSQVEDFKEINAFLDLGTGAGFPGIPLKIAYPHLCVTLLDSRQKRLNFLDSAVRSLDLKNVTLIHARAEEAGHDPVHREAYDCVTARAVTELILLAEWMLPFLRKGGLGIAWKGPKIGDEIQEAQSRIEEAGGTIERILPAEIPGTSVERSLVIIRKTVATPSQFPRSKKQIERKDLS
jgi:16S rRNA (guanine527-N7)-methyltransferase